MSEFKCSSNCGCKVRIEHVEACAEKLKKEISDVKKLMMGNLITGVLVLIGVVANLLYFYLRAAPLPG